MHTVVGAVGDVNVEVGEGVVVVQLVVVSAVAVFAVAGTATATIVVNNRMVAVTIGTLDDVVAVTATDVAFAVPVYVGVVDRAVTAAGMATVITAATMVVVDVVAVVVTSMHGAHSHRHDRWLQLTIRHSASATARQQRLVLPIGPIIAIEGHIPVTATTTATMSTPYVSGNLL